ncbi:hypothetical protein [Streptomyces sp. NPDC086787]|uniref:hypothetical protein n=1 Tax=Streptomyces sp. NPDC086787 TaxID=3365759 RepID=UPI00382E1931
MRPTMPGATPDHGAGRGASEVTRKRSPHRPRDTTALRRRLLLLSVRLWWHPYWETHPSVPAARSERRQLARARRAVQAA